jgi:hypothetical protein
MFQGGSNQHMSFPNINPGAQPGAMPSGIQNKMGFQSESTGFNPWGYTGLGTMGNQIGNTQEINKNLTALPTTSPQFTQDFYKYIQDLMVKGQQPYQGQLSAEENPILQELMSFLTGGGSNTPGMNELGQMAQTGMPTDVGPAWEAMMASQQRNIDQNLGNIREQFAFGGNLKSSPFGSAVTDYMTQTGLDQNALLAQMHMQAQEGARGRQLQAGQFMGELGAGAGEFFQNLDQASLDRLYQEFLRTRPENNPMNQIFGAAATNSPNVAQQGSGSTIGGIGSLASGGGAALIGIAAL